MRQLVKGLRKGCSAALQLLLWGDRKGVNPESSVVNKLKRMGTSQCVRDGYTMWDLEMCLGEDHDVPTFLRRQAQKA